MAERIRGLSIGLDLESAGITRSLSEIRRSFNTLNSDLKLTSNNFKYTEKSTGSYKQRIKELDGTVGVYKKNVGELAKEYERVKKEQGENSKQAMDLRKEYNKQANELNRLEHELGNTTEEFKRFQKEQDIANSKWTIFGKNIDSAGDKLQNIGGKLTGIGGKMTATVTTAFAGLGLGAVKAAGDYDAAASQFSQVFGKLEGDATTNLEKISKETGLLPNSLKGSFTQIAAFAKTSGMESKDALDLTSRATLAAADSAAFYDKSIEEVTESLQSYLKGNFENDAALGISSTETTRNAKANEKYGKSFKDLSEDQKQLTLLAMVEDGNKLSGALGQAARESDQLGTQTSNLKTAFKDMLAELGKPILPTAVDMLKQMSGALKGGAEWFSGLSDGAKKGIVGVGVFLAALGPVITGMGVMATSIGSIMKLFAPLSLAIGKTAGQAGIFGGKLTFLKPIFTVLTGPIGIAIATITALGVAFVIAYKKSETFRNIVNGVVNAIKQTFMNFLTFIQPFTNGIVNTFKSIVGAISAFATQIGNQISAFWNKNGAEIKQALTNIFNVFKTIFMAIYTVISTVFNTLIIPIIKVGMKVIQSVMSVVWTLVKALVVSTWNNIKGVIQGALNIIMGVIKVFSSLFTGNWKGLWSGIKQILKGSVQLIWNLINLWFVGKILGTVRVFGGLFKGLFSGIWNTVKKIFTTALSAVFNSSKRSFTNIFNIGKSIFNALKNFFSSIWNAIKGVFTSSLKNIWNGVRNNFNRIFNFGRDTFTKLKNTMSNLWNGIKDNTIGKAQAMKDKVTGIFKSMGSGIKGHIDTIKGHIGGMTKNVKKGLNNLISGVNWVGGKLGMDKIPEMKLSTGTGSLTKNGKLAQDTFATVGDKGRGNGPNGFRHEMIRYPNGKTVLTPDKDTKAFLPRGSQVINGQDTYNYLNSPRFAKGTGKPFYNQLGDAVGKTWNSGVDATKDFAGKTIKGAKEIGKQALDAIGDVYDFATNPGKLVDKVLKTFGVDFSFMKGDILSGLMGGMYKKLKGSVKALFTTWLNDGGSGGDGSSFTKFGKTTPYSPNGAVPGYPSSFNGGKHYGIDYATPTGTVLKAPTAGTVAKQHNHGGGLVDKLLSGKFTQFFLHLSEVLKTGPVKKGEAFAKTGNSGAWTTGAHLHYQVEKGNPSELTNTNTIDPEKFLSGISGGKDTVGKKWSSEIRRAAKQMKVSVSESDVSAINAQIMRESSGNQNIVQSSSVWDVNTASGNPAQGLLQYIPQTFKSYAVKGHGNIRSGYDQLLAFFNNSNWRRDNPGGKSGWGPTGNRRFATGGLIKNAGWYNIAEGGYPEWVIPTDPKRSSEAMAMLAMAANQIRGNKTAGNKRPSQLTGGLSTTNDNALLLRMMQQQQEQIALLAQIVQSNQQIADKDFTIDKYEHKKQVFEGIDDYNRQKSRKSQFRPSFA